MARLPGGEAIFASAVESLRLALADASQWAFVLGAAVCILGLVAALLLEEIPLRRTFDMPSPAPGATPTRQGLAPPHAGPPAGPAPAPWAQPGTSVAVLASDGGSAMAEPEQRSAGPPLPGAFEEEPAPMTSHEGRR